MQFQIHFYSNIYQQKTKKLSHCQFLFRYSTLRNVVDRALTSAVTSIPSLFLSLFDKVDFNRLCNSSYNISYDLFGCVPVLRP